MMESRVPIRVLVVDDSVVMRSLLRMTLVSCPEVELVGMATDGVGGLEAIERLKPHLVLLDIEMPRMDGLETLAEIRGRKLPVKVIMCSTLTRRGAGITLEALARGAADYVAKPTAHQDVRDGMEAFARELLPKICALFSAGEDRRRTGVIRAPVSVSPQTAVTAPAAVLAIGVSTGGPAALERFLPALRAGFPVPVLIVQHMPPLFTALLAERLDGLCKVHVREAVDAEALQAGVAYLARGDWHMQTVGSSARCSLRLTQASPEQHCRPSVDVLFRSVATTYRAGALAVVLTGMGSDGLDGCRAIHAAGGRILVQDRETSAVWGMPGVVAAAGLADQVLALESMVAEVVRSTSRYPGNKPA
jgi:two-component system, chemotaxis family, protein-glutamate methylesterase/glutaminase